MVIVFLYKSFPEGFASLQKFAVILCGWMEPDSVHPPMLLSPEAKAERKAARKAARNDRRAAKAIATSWRPEVELGMQQQQLQYEKSSQMQQVPPPNSQRSVNLNKNSMN